MRHGAKSFYNTASAKLYKLSFQEFQWGISVWFKKNFLAPPRKCAEHPLRMGKGDGRRQKDRRLRRRYL